MLTLVLLLGCAPARSASEPVRPPSPTRAAPVAVEAAADDVLVSVDGRSIRKTHLADFFLRYRRDSSREALTQIVDTLLVEADGSSLGLTVPAPVLAGAVDEAIRARRVEVEETYRGAVPWGEYLERTLGLTPEAYREEVTGLLRVSLSLDRLIRLEQIRTDRVEIRRVVVPTRAEADEVVGKLAAGADLLALAREVSLAPGVAPPPIAADDLPADLVTALDGRGPGAVAPPFREERDGREVWHVVKLVRRLPARDARWNDVAAEIEAGLERRPREAWEYEEWARRARDRHRIRWSVR